MPPRIPLVSRLRPQSNSALNPLHPQPTIASSAPTSTILSSHSFTLPHRPASTLAQKRRHQDPYAAAQARARKAANLSRQSVLQAERTKARGDPIRGVTRTPLIEAFKAGTPLFSQPQDSIDPSAAASSGGSGNVTSTDKSTATHFRNYFIADDELTASVQHSDFLASPLETPSATTSADPKTFARKAENHRLDHEVAAEALRRITDLENASSKDRTRVNVQRCVELFGRHNTDTFLREPLKSRAHLPRRHLEQERGGAVAEAQVAESPSASEDTSPTDAAATAPSTATEAVAGTTATTTPIPPRERAGPDTGSSEVQIGILTARINTLADQLESSRGRNDKVNKRNLRLLVHKRQKLLQYLRRSDRGGERWQRCVGMLGLGEAAWVGEISL